MSALVVVVVMLTKVGSGSGDTSDVPHEWLVTSSDSGMGQVPTSNAVIVEAVLISAEVGTLLHGTDAAQSVL